MAEAMLRHALRERLGDGAAAVEVTSAGTYGLVDEPMDPSTVDVLRRAGIADEPFAARQLTADLVAGADLVLTATREHRAAVVTLHPAASRYAFTILEFARLAAQVPVPLPGATPAERGRALVRAAAGNRGLVPPRDRPDGDDVPDPYRRSIAAFDAVGEAMRPALEQLAERLAG